MIARIFLLWVLLAFAIRLTAWIMPGVDIDTGFGQSMLVALLLSLVNVTLGTLLRVLTLPLQLITLGLFGIVVNTALLALVAWLSDALSIDSFFAALFAGILISAISGLLQLLVMRGLERPEAARSS